MITAIFSVLGAILSFLLKTILVILLVVLVLVAFMLLCPFCADVTWQGGVLGLRVGAFGLTFPVLPRPEKPKQEPPQQPPRPARKPGLLGKLKAKLREALALQRRKSEARKAARKAALAARRQKEHAKPRKNKLSAQEKFEIALDVLCALLQGAGRIIAAVFGALRFTHIRVRFSVRGADKSDTTVKYGKMNAWLYGSLGFLDRFFFLGIDQLQLVPDFSEEGTGSEEDVIAFRVSAQLLFIVIAAVCMVIELLRRKVLDLFLK